ncbi:MAG: DUF6644 family protein [Alphaproteobacteria bacterium]|nr:DUF6644 family protein [Alphaproteobacteria bacterium]
MLQGRFAEVFHEFFRWLQEDLGFSETLAASWSQQFLGSFNLWSLMEGTHVVTLMLFAGTIWIVDLRMLGVIFKDVPFSKINDRILPYTMVGFAAMIVTGFILFLAKPMDYYHNVWFRAKIIFLIIASINIFWFHYKVQKNQDEWDANPNPPFPVKLSAMISLTSWVLIILFGRFIAYNWYECGKPQPGFVEWFAECSAYPGGVVSGEEIFEEGEPTEDETVGEGAAPTAADGVDPPPAEPGEETVPTEAPGEEN